MGRKTLKVGMSLWHVLWDIGDKDAKSYLDLEPNVIRSIKRVPRRRSYRRVWTQPEGPVTVYATAKNSATYGIVERTLEVGKHGKQMKQGWLSSIDACFRTSFTLEEYVEKGLPSGLSYTKYGAVHNAILKCKKDIKDYQKGGSQYKSYDQDIDWERKELEDVQKRLKRMLGRLERKYNELKNTGEKK